MKKRKRKADSTMHRLCVAALFPDQAHVVREILEATITQEIERLRVGVRANLRKNLKPETKNRYMSDLEPAMRDLAIISIRSQSHFLGSLLDEYRVASAITSSLTAVSRA